MDDPRYHEHELYRSSMTSQALLDQLCERGIIPACSCGKKVTYISESVGGAIYTLGCPGCRKAINKCTCVPYTLGMRIDDLWRHIRYGSGMSLRVSKLPWRR